MKVKNIVHVSTYTKDKETKKKYVQVGQLLMFDDGGIKIKLEYIPVNFKGELSVYDQDKKPRLETMEEQRQKEIDQNIKEIKEEEIPF